MGRNGVKISGILFLTYSIVMLLSGIIYIAVTAEYMPSLLPMFFLIVNRIVVPIISIGLSVVAFLVSKNRRVIVLFLGFHIIYLIFLIINGIISAAVFADGIDEYNTHLYNLVLGSVLDISSYVLNVIAFIIMITGIVANMTKKKITKAHLISCVLMAVGFIITVCKNIMYILTPGVIFVNPEAAFIIISKAILIVAVFLLGNGINNEVKNNSNLQE